jgi:hypothetical protein
VYIDYQVSNLSASALVLYGIPRASVRRAIQEPWTTDMREKTAPRGLNEFFFFLCQRIDPDFQFQHWSTLIAKAYSEHAGCAALAIKIIKKAVIAPSFDYNYRRTVELPGAPL